MRAALLLVALTACESLPTSPSAGVGATCGCGFDYCAVDAGADADPCAYAHAGSTVTPVGACCVGEQP